MREENSVVKVKKTAKYNSYAGEVTPAVPNMIGTCNMGGLAG